MRWSFRRIAIGMLLMLLGSVLTPTAKAESDQVRIVVPYGLAYLPTYIAVDRGLIEQHAKAAGLGDIKVTLVHMASGPASSDLLLSGDADLAMGGCGPACILWDKTRGAGRVRIVTPFSSSPIWMLSNDPHIQSIRDIGPNDRIAVSAVKVTGQALALQMAAANEFGWASGSASIQIWFRCPTPTEWPCCFAAREWSGHRPRSSRSASRR